MEAIAKIESSPNVIVTYAKTNCAILGHRWLTNEKKIKWAPDMQTATVYFSCGIDSSHISPSLTLPVTKTELNDRSVYTISTDPYIYKKIPKLDNNGKPVKDSDGNMVLVSTGLPETYSKVVLKGVESTSETIKLNSSNTTGDITSSTVSEKKHFYRSQLWPTREMGHYKEAFNNATFTINSGVIKPGARSFTLDMDAGEEILDININLYSQYGELLGSMSTKDSKPTMYLFPYTDSQLTNCKVKVNISTHHKRHTLKGAIGFFAKAYSNVKSIKINY